MQKKWSLGWVDSLSKLRDVALIASGALYVAGYLSRSLHALIHNLGALPGVQLEYFVAGFMLLLPLGALALVVWLIWIGLKALAAWTAGEPFRQKAVATVLGVGVFASLAVFVAPGGFLAPIKDLAMLTFLGSLVLSVAYSAAGGKMPEELPAVADVASAVTTPKTVEEGQEQLSLRILHRIGEAFAYLTVLNGALLVLLIIVAMVAVGAFSLKYVPQELGGVRPKCAQFVLTKDALSDGLFAVLAKDSAGTSVAVDVYSSGDPWLVKLPGAPEGSATYRLGRESVRAMAWCPTFTPQKEAPTKPATSP